MLIPIAMALAQFAPMIAGWLGGSKAEDVASKVVGIAQTVTGQSAPDAALAAVQADPSLALQFQKAVLDQQAQLAQINAQAQQAQLTYEKDIYAAEASDRDSARHLAAQQPKDWMRPLLSIIVVAATIGIVFLVLLGVADGTLKDPVIAATAGGLMMYFVRESSQVLGFWFGMTKEASVTNAKVADFAVAPGTVTNASAPAASATQ